MARRKGASLLAKAMASSMVLSIAKKLLLFKNRRIKKHQFSRHYSYVYMRERQFSPSSSPIFLIPRGPRRRARKMAANVRALVRSLLCHGDRAVSVVEMGTAVELKALPDFTGPAADDDGYAEAEEDDGGEEEELLSVDGMAERFIQKFYAEMRLQEESLIAA